MKIYPLLLITLILLAACTDRTTTEIRTTYDLHVLPHPKSMSETPSALQLSAESKIYASEASLEPLAALLSTEVHKAHGVAISSTMVADAAADIILEINSSLETDAYGIEVADEVRLSGGSYHALAMAKTTLLQLMRVEEEKIIIPHVSISDSPDASYRGLMIDLARQWHDISTIEQLIDLAAYYKMNYVHLHFTDDQSFTLPSRHYPKLSTENRHYSFAELEALETYAVTRGITIIPELEVPGHASQFVEKYPDIFAIQDADQNARIINMGREEVYTAIEKLIGEIASTFQSSPYIHVGGDEAVFTKVMNDPDVQQYMQTHELPQDVHELYRHFLVRMNDIVKKHGKQMCVWEGFSRVGQIEIPKDIIVFEFETNRYLPDELVADGYTVVNTSWKPLYIVNQKKWEPKTIYDWNMWKWHNWWVKAPSFQPIQVDSTALIMGAQMCSWEQPANVEVPSIRKRIPAFAERLWNTEPVLPYDRLMHSMDQTDSLLSNLIDDARQDSLLIDYNFAAEE